MAGAGEKLLPRAGFAEDQKRGIDRCQSFCLCLDPCQYLALADDVVKSGVASILKGGHDAAKARGPVKHHDPAPRCVIGGIRTIINMADRFDL